MEKQIALGAFVCTQRNFSLLLWPDSMAALSALEPSRCRRQWIALQQKIVLDAFRHILLMLLQGPPTWGETPT